MTDQKDLFPILDRTHIKPTKDDAILDFGCGKGAPMLSFLDYGFYQVGGIEMEKGLYDVLKDNIIKLELSQEYSVECILADATTINNQLDKYNYFFLFSPFYGSVFEKVINNISDSITRKSLKIILLLKYPIEQRYVEPAEFILINQFLIDAAQRVVSIYTN